jgi:hypothetical protein
MAASTEGNLPVLRALLTIFAMFWSVAALATDHVQENYQQEDRAYRESSEYLSQGEAFTTLEDFQKLVRNVFREAYTSDVRIRVLVQPSFAREYAVGLKETNGTFTAFWVESKVQLWGYGLLDMFKKGQIVGVRDGKSTNAEEIARLEAELPQQPNNVPLMRCQKPIESALAQRILFAWSQMLTRARPDKSYGLDGDTYEFAMIHGDKTITGTAWSPAPGSRDDLLINVVIALRRVCMNNFPLAFLYRHQLVSALDNLEKRLEADRP